MLKYFKAISNVLWILGIFHDHLVQFELIWYIFSSFGIMYQEKSDDPGLYALIQSANTLHMYVWNYVA
jgi:hypothetical protein